MTVDEAITAYSRLTLDQQVQVLARHAHDLTVIARGTYVPGTEDIADPRRLRMLNEVQHRVTGQLRHLLADDPNRYPDDVIVRIIVAEDDPELLAGLGPRNPTEQLTRQCSGPARGTDILMACL